MKEKKIYFLFSRMQSDQRAKVIYEMVVNFFLNNNNNFFNLNDISKYILEHFELNFSPETIRNCLNNINHKQIFENYSTSESTDTPFKLVLHVFNNLSNYDDYVSLLNSYVKKFLGSKGYPKNRADNIINLLLEIMYNRNIEYLRKLLTVKEEINLKNELKLTEKHIQFSRKNCELYNELIIDSDNEFDEIMRILIVKMFHYLSLYFNPMHNEIMNKSFSGKIYYLDSSFILRLLGFDNEYREQRTINLIDILKQISGIKFYIHRETLNEAQYRIKEIINQTSKLLSANSPTINKILPYIDNKSSDTVDLFNRMKAKGIVSNSKDFLLYFSNISNILTEILGNESFKIVDDKIKVNRKKSFILYRRFLDTDKSTSRIKHIIRLICHIENLRGDNNNNPLDIKHWLLTTDTKTLHIDYSISNDTESPIKSVCILPTEIIRNIDGIGEITGEHMNVFKKYMLQTRTFKESYTQKDINTILKIAAIVETTDKEHHKTDELIANLFTQNSFEDIQNRLDKIEDELKQNEFLIEMFNDANEAFIETKYSKVISKILLKSTKEAKIIFAILLFIVPIILSFYLIIKIFNPSLIITDPLTYIDVTNWTKLEGIFVLFEIFIWSGCIFLNKKFKKKFIGWYTKRALSEYK